MSDACAVCGADISYEREIAAATRGTRARYCSQKCRATAAKRRQRSARRKSLEALFAAKYVWWKGRGPSERRVVAQLMDIGDYDDVRAFERARGDRPFLDAITNAEPGWFSPRSWKYWNLRLGLMAPGNATPPIPTRRYA